MAGTVPRVLHAAAVQLDQAPRQGEAETPGAGARRGGRAVHAQHDVVGVVEDAQRDAAAGGRVFRDVRQQVADDLLEPREIPDHPRRTGVDVKLVVPNRQGRHALARELREVDPARGEGGLSSGDALHVQQLVDEATGLVELTPEHVARGGDAGVARGQTLDQAGGENGGGQRGAQLVR